MLSHEMHLAFIANDRYSSRVTEVNATWLLKANRCPRSMVKAFIQMLNSFSVVPSSLI